MILSRGAGLWQRWRRLAVPSLFFLLVIYYEEIVLKLSCFQALSPAGAVFTLLFSLPLSLLLGLLCGGISPRRGRFFLVLSTVLLSFWMGSQAIYYRLFKTFFSLFSITKMLMVAESFGHTAAGEVLLNWFVVLLMALPIVLSVLLRRRIVGEQTLAHPRPLRWVLLAVLAQLIPMGIVMLCGGGVLSLRYIYTQAAVPELEVQNFGMITQTQLEIRRVFFGIDPDDEDPTLSDPVDPDDLPRTPAPFSPGTGRGSTPWTSTSTPWPGTRPTRTCSGQPVVRQREPTPENQWTGYFEGKNLIWIVAESFSATALDPERTPTLWKLSHEGFVFDHFYTPLWGVSTSDGEYVTTTSLIPKSGVWSYSLSSDNYMPFSLGRQFRQEGYRTLAFHDYLYDYYDRFRTHQNMGYDFYAIGQGLHLESADQFPPPTWR